MDRHATRIELGGNQFAVLPMNTEDPPREIARRLLDRVGCHGPFAIESIPGGRNNRVWRIRANETDFLLKQYYWTENDQRDRMGHEWDFLAYLHGIGITVAPQPLAADRENRCALLEFIDGAPLTLSEIGEREILSAADFFSGMNAGRFSDAGRALPAASEACFSLEEHVQTTGRRICRLVQIAPAGEVHREAVAFVSGNLLPLWARVRAQIIEMAPENGGVDRKLAPPECCLSPSDFGFHNALRMPAGRLRFVDFEYAGWDDPAKTIADFANQPDVLLDARLSAIFAARVLALFSDGPSLAARLRLLTPLYQIKWACICLNEFLPAGSDRRAFTGLRTDQGPTRLAGHLERARVMSARAAKSLDFPTRKSTVSSLPRPSL